jgi:predicted methyltransferase
MRDKKGKKITWKQFWKRWWKGIQQVKEIKEINKEVDKASKIYNEKEK